MPPPDEYDNTRNAKAKTGKANPKMGTVPSHMRSKIAKMSRKSTKNSASKAPHVNTLSETGKAKPNMGTVIDEMLYTVDKESADKALHAAAVDTVSSESNARKFVALSRVRQKKVRDLARKVAAKLRR